ncbi:MAG: MlaD family protein [Hyphomicrobiaceae bacterium]|nr:MlaD family protein [Hyphomicrobiaceae bacterium]
METKANHILIGAFLLVATFAGFAFVFWIQNYGTGNSVNRYYILFKGPVTGLAPASTVLFNGLKVGKIEAFEIDPLDPRNTKVLVTIRKTIPVRRNSTARIVSQGLSAYSSVMVTPGTPDEKVLKPLPDGTLPVILAVSGSGRSLMEAAPEVLNNANTVLRRIDELVANNEKLVRDTLKNIEGFTKELDRNKGRIASLMENADQTVATANQAAQKANDTLARLDKILADNEKKISLTMDSITKTAQNAESFSLMLKNNEQPVSDILASIRETSKNAEKFSAMLASKDTDITAILDNVRTISEQFKTVAGKLEGTLDSVSGFVSNENGTSMMTEISLAATSFKNLAEKLDQSLGNSAKGMARFATNGLREFEGLMREGRRMVKAMERVMNKIERNPQGLIFGAKQVREYKSN